MKILRELLRTLDVMLGGDHRRYGHLPPDAVTPPTEAPPKPGKPGPPNPPTLPPRSFA